MTAERVQLAGGLRQGPPPSEPTQRDLAVLIVAYRVPRDVATCLDAVAAHLPGAPVLVWDNSGPEYPGMDEVREAYPTVEWHGDGRNLGFAAAVNRLADLVPGHDLLLLNPDAVLCGGLDATRSALRRHGVAAAAPEVHDAEDAGGRRRGWDVAHRRRGVLRGLVSRAGYAEVLRRTPFSDLYAEPPERVEGYLTGACLAISRDAWDALGPFDEEFFLYGEETDWQRRAVDAGWSLELTDDAGVEHSGHGTVRDDAVAWRRSADLLRANMALNIEHAAGARAAGAFLLGDSLLDRLQRSKRASRGAVARGDLPNVVFTVNRLVFGGAERHHLVLAGELQRRGYPVTVVCLQRFGPLIAEAPDGVRVVRQPWWGPLLDLPAGPAILISGDTNTETGFATLWRAGGRGRRWLVGAHIPPETDGPTYSAPLAAAMRRSDGFVALSPAHRDSVSAHQRVARGFSVAPNGVARRADLKEVPARRPVDRAPRLVMLSRIVEHKNPHLLVQALAGLTEYAWELDIFGDGPDRARLEALTPPELAGRVRWRGWSPGPEHAFADADLVCVPSGSEAFPMVILEAMARRVPVAASAVCAVPDMLDDGAAGALVHDVTVAGWREALRDLLSRPEDWAELGERGFARMREHYTVESMADAYEAAFAEAMAVRS
ncbi:glycosyltransferase [Tsukamurella ocularis]|uniref:glycosyltransferase n=1 Tax=Tsukamurella ocularis TaxID=1970234 RepID=UPI002167BCD6|nr:glycosyltransferase [Tsukamurella ocularis]MCS3779450.1 glycosyltransferase involved in cell wall biosynthesis/GT2 family glycosyltransferase [Tsukamurella ocularis]MCS3788076.1 glycosyltransferase involved in cell wall biosynthesis/GT2 family glycosyltransferase [Tsukamurella ocularis]MCS3852392.1 glycosyltransferase involved in cell wall biosynthesis/GT2 family glycosyltransferase [Tsukamurella ocularis]